MPNTEGSPTPDAAWTRSPHTPERLSELATDPAGRRRRPVPPRAIALSIAALLIPASVPFVGSAPEPTTEYDALLWLLALVPAFLLAYYRGWSGAATALAAGMAVLSLVQVAVVTLGIGIGNWPFLLAVVVFYAGICLAVGWVSELLHRAREQAEHAALTDELTGLPNRRCAKLVLEKEFEAARRGRPLAVVLFDLDELKRYNDRYGHIAGDEALSTFARALSGVTRKMNLSARLGGDEFLSVLSCADRAGARAVAQRVRDELAAVQSGAASEITVSVGIAEYDEEMPSVAALLSAADRDLYADKTRVGADSDA